MNATVGDKDKIDIHKISGSSQMYSASDYTPLFQRSASYRCHRLLDVRLISNFTRLSEILTLSDDIRASNINGVKDSRHCLF